MRSSFSVAALVVALLLAASSTYGYGLREFFGCGCRDGGGCGCEADCGCEPACGCDQDCGCDVGCGCEAGCGCEPGCGRGCGCGIDGRQFAGQTWNCCQECTVPICPCTGPDGSCQGGCCDHAGGCGDCCEPACGCGGCGDACGCGSCGDDGGSFCLKHCGFGSWIGCVLGAVCKPCGCSGCSGETYWCEWHNDPPRCCDPCDRCGNWIGPGAGYRAPYDHPYAPAGYSEGVYAKNGAAARTSVAARNTPAQPRGQIARQRNTPAFGTYQR